MPTVYTRPIATAKRLIVKYGQSVTWRSITDGALPDPNEPWNAGPTTDNDTTVDIVFFTKNLIDKETQKYSPGTVIGAGQTVGYMGFVAGLTPDIKDIVVRNGQILSIEFIDVLKPAGEVVLYTIGFEN